MGTGQCLTTGMMSDHRVEGVGKETADLTGAVVSLDGERKVRREYREIIWEDAYILLWNNTEVIELIDRFRKILKQYGANKGPGALVQQCVVVLQRYLNGNCEVIVDISVLIEHSELSLEYQTPAVSD